MRKSTIAVIMAVSATICYATTTVTFPGLEALVEKADAIVILRIDRPVPRTTNSYDSYTINECFIYQSLKGDIPPRTRITLTLMDTNQTFGTPFTRGSHHLAFLTKKQTDYRSLAYEGANIRISPLGNETTPEGDSIADQIRTVVKQAKKHLETQQKREAKFLDKILSKYSPAPLPLGIKNNLSASAPPVRSR